MNYDETITYIHNTPKFSRNLGNDMLKKLLFVCGNPQNKLKFIHIAGTNGKGSTASMIAEIFRESGYCVGLFTSPYLVCFNERIRVNGEEIPNDALSKITTDLRKKIEENDAQVSEFALDTAIALLWFQEQKTDVVVWETGLGGRLDATNIIPEKEVAVLTQIGLDHMQYLGESLSEITKEKCGIFQENRFVISYPAQEEVVALTISKIAEEKHCPLKIASVPKRTQDGMIYHKKRYTLGLSGEYQIMNAATALETVFVLREMGYCIPENAIQSGLYKAKNSCRYEWVQKNILIDGAHNPSAIHALCKSLSQEKKEIVFCTAMMEDKDYAGILKILSLYSNTIILTQLDMPRCCKVSELKRIAKSLFAKVICFNHPQDAIDMARKIANQAGTVCICGSLYFAGYALRSLHN